MSGLSQKIEVVESTVSAGTTTEQSLRPEHASQEVMNEVLDEWMISSFANERAHPARFGYGYCSLRHACLSQRFQAGRIFTNTTPCAGPHCQGRAAALAGLAGPYFPTPEERPGNA